MEPEESLFGCVLGFFIYVLSLQHRVESRDSAYVLLIPQPRSSLLPHETLRVGKKRYQGRNYVWVGSLMSQLGRTEVLTNHSGSPSAAMVPFVAPGGKGNERNDGMATHGWFRIVRPPLRAPG